MFCDIPLIRTILRLERHKIKIIRLDGFISGGGGRFCLCYMYSKTGWLSFYCLTAPVTVQLLRLHFSSACLDQDHFHFYFVLKSLQKLDHNGLVMCTNYVTKRVTNAFKTHLFNESFEARAYCEDIFNETKEEIKSSKNDNFGPNQLKFFKNETIKMTLWMNSKFKVL